MAGTAVQNPPAKPESKSAKKKKAAKAERTDSPAPSSTLHPDKPTSVAGQEGAGDDSESPYIRELQKNIRNLNKKIAATAKIDQILAENPGKTIDDLIASKALNADQKVQYSKKASQQAQHQQLEEQLSQYKKLDSEYRGRALSAKAELEKSLTEKHEKDKAEALAEVKAEAEKKSAAELNQTLHNNFLVLSQFLRLAAARRAEGADPSLDENLALEGVLLNIYSGDDNAVTTMLKLVQGSDDVTTDVQGQSLHTTYSQIKAAAIEYAAPASQVDATTEESPSQTEQVASDPTVAHAGLTEIDEGTTVALTNGHADSAAANGSLPVNAEVADDAANAAAENNWDPAQTSPDNDLAGSAEWVKLPRDLSETETGLTASVGNAANTQSWADDTPEPPSQESTTSQPADDGFHQVQRNHHRGRSDRGDGYRGGYRGNDRGHFRGRGGGFRGDGRGTRGRGGNRGRGDGGFAMRGPRQQDS